MGKTDRGYQLSGYVSGKLDFFHSMEVIFLGYFHITGSITILNCLWNCTKVWKLDFPTFLYNISKIFPNYGRGPIFAFR